MRRRSKVALIARLSPYRVRVERQPIGLNVNNADVSEQLGEGLLGAVSVAEKVEVTGWALQSACPE